LGAGDPESEVFRMAATKSPEADDSDANILRRRLTLPVSTGVASQVLAFRLALRLLEMKTPLSCLYGIFTLSIAAQLLERRTPPPQCVVVGEPVGKIDCSRA
jgi:hypothetical protein